MQGVRAGFCLTMIFLFSLAAVLFRPLSFYEAVYHAEGHISGMVQRVMGKRDAQASAGIVSRENNYRTKEAQLELTISDLPTEPLYLKGFSGGDYAGNRWERANDENLLKEAARILGWEEWLGMISVMYNHMYYVLNRDTVRENPPEARKLHIRQENGNYRNIYIPYYSGSKWFRRESDGIWEEGYECEYYETKDMGIVWDGRQTSLGEAREWYRLLQEAYSKTVQNAYTRVPEELLPRLAALAAENPKKDLEEITAFIVYTLQSRASYTLTPGWTPMNKDIVEYFLFENGQGYCQHFAAAATLLYRLYGVPARYASGYVVQPSDFEMQDGIWKAEITDESAHAWVEIFLEDYGWTPVEVTPAADGRIFASYPGIDSTAQTWLADGIRRKDEDEKAYENESGERDKEWERGYSVILDFEKYREGYLALGTCLLCFLCFTPVLLDYRRLRFRQKLEHMECGSVYAVMMDMLHYAGYFLDKEGWEREFPRIVSEEFPQIEEEVLRRQQEIVKEAAYGPKKANAADEQFVRWVYVLLAEEVFRRMKGYRRMLFRYWKKFG